MEYLQKQIDQDSQYNTHNDASDNWEKECAVTMTAKITRKFPKLLGSDGDIVLVSSCSSVMQALNKLYPSLDK